MFSEGDRVEDWFGRKGTVIEEVPYSVRLACGCCDEIGFRYVVRWDDEPEDAELEQHDADELRLI